MHANGILRIGFVMALGMAAATIGCGDDDTNTNKDAAQDAKDGGAGGKTDGGTGGAGGVGGAADAGDGAVGTKVLYDFATTAQGFALNTYAQADGGAMAGTVGWDGSNGNPPGALKLTAAFTDVMQMTASAVTVGVGAGDWGGKKVIVRYKASALLDASLQGVVALNVMTGTGAPNWTFIKGSWCTLKANTDWNECVVDLTGVTDVVGQFQVVLQTGNSAAPDAGAPAGDVTVYVDNITLE